ncbi:MAG: hypothetical protein GYB36_03250 [Alphaproteobacteria bacterium]|nr:hypothetical protein [Alphaproteobacteria bacterium]
MARNGNADRSAAHQQYQAPGKGSLNTGEKIQEENNQEDTAAGGQQYQVCPLLARCDHSVRPLIYTLRDTLKSTA